MLRKRAKLAALRVLLFPHRIIPRSLQRQGSLTAFADGMSFRELLDRSQKLAGYWARLGLQKGDRVIVDLPNCREFVETRIAAILAGMVAVPIPRATSDEGLAFIAHSTQAKSYIGTRSTVLHGIENLLDLGPELQDREPYEEAIHSATPLRTTPSMRGSDLLAINFTSGSTGSPKGVMSTIASWGWSLYFSLRENRAEIGPNEVFLHALPLSTAGSSLLLPAVLSGSKSVFLHNWDPAEACRLIEQDRVTRVFLTPTMLAELCEEVQYRRADLRSLCAVIYGTEGIPPARIRKALSIFGPILQQGYGMAEALPPIAILHQDEHADAVEGDDAEILSSVGKPTAAVRIRIVSTDDQPLQRGEEGHIQLAGKTLSPGYWMNSDLTEQTRCEGFYRTGDIGHVDPRGYLHIAGRYGRTLEQASKGLVEWAETRDDVSLAWARETNQTVTLHIVPSRRHQMDTATFANEATRGSTHSKDILVQFHEEAPKTGSYKLDLRETPPRNEVAAPLIHDGRP